MIWLYWGNKTMSFLRYMTVHSACALNDRVVLIVRSEGVGRDWTEKQDMTHYTGPDYTECLNDLSNLEIVPLDMLYSDIALMHAPEIHTSDLLAWRLLADYGGTVSDMDIVYVKPVPKVTEKVQLIKFDFGYYPVSFMQGKPCVFWKEVYELALERYSANNYESCGAPILQELVTPGAYKRLPSETVFPFHNWPWARMRHGLFRFAVERLPKKTIGIHWFAGANQQSNNRFQHNTYKEHLCTISKAIQVTYAG